MSKNKNTILNIKDLIATEVEKLRYQNPDIDFDIIVKSVCDKYFVKSGPDIPPTDEKKLAVLRANKMSSVGDFQETIKQTTDWSDKDHAKVASLIRQRAGLYRQKKQKELLGIARIHDDIGDSKTKTSKVGWAKKMSSDVSNVSNLKTKPAEVNQVTAKSKKVENVIKKELWKSTYKYAVKNPDVPISIIIETVFENFLNKAHVSLAKLKQQLGKRK